MRVFSSSLIQYDNFVFSTLVSLDMAQEEDQSFNGEVVRLNPEYEDSFIEGNLHMVGKIIPDKKVSFRTCKAALLGIWENPKGVAISNVGRNKVLINFRDASKGV
ncbi:uncharacterized protein DS421_15g490160 [Arachis hypogaea]|nr:uncharacterized protein DS421_15g490160 [Arachis hypogaea]